MAQDMKDNLQMELKTGKESIGILMEDFMMARFRMIKSMDMVRNAIFFYIL